MFLIPLNNFRSDLIAFTQKHNAHNGSDTRRIGVKASRLVNEKEEAIIASKVINGYSRNNPYLPSGICKGCVFDLRNLDVGTLVNIHLPESYDCGLGRQTRSAGMAWEAERYSFQGLEERSHRQD